MSSGTIYLLDPFEQPVVRALEAVLWSSSEYRVSTLANQCLSAADFTDNFDDSATFLWMLCNRPPTNNNPNELRNYFIEQEWWNLMLSLAALRPPTQFFNHPLKMLLASSKPLQLQHAKAAGFRTPRTLITNRKSELRSFVDDLGHALFKPVDTSLMSNPNNPHESVFISPIRIGCSQIESFSDDEVEQVPVIVQEYVDKEFEIRAIAFEDETVMVRIDSQRHASSAVDWRYRQADTSMFTLMQRDSTLERQVANYLKRLHLQHGVFDLAVSKNDDLYFLECNPGGQWLWLDSIAGGKISRVFARSICHHHLNVLQG